MRILLTGHKGYIGAVMVPMLLAAGHEVVGLDSDLFEHCTFGDGLGRCPRSGGTSGTWRRRDLEGFDAVVHLAALCRTTPSAT